MRQLLIEEVVVCKPNSQSAVLGRLKRSTMRSWLTWDVEIKESDWKVFRRLHSIALERYCQRVIEEVRLAAACNDSYHDCYLKVFQLIRDRDKTMARAFDDPRRSTAMVLLLNIVNEGLLTDDELKQFSQELRGRIEAIKWMSRT